MGSFADSTTRQTPEFKLGDWWIRPIQSRLARDNETIQIEPKSMDVLVDLAKHPRVVRSKRRLLHVVWGEAFVSDDVLTHAIWELRKALGDDYRNPRYIETIPRKGYRLIASVVPPLPPDTEPGGRPFHYAILERLGGGGMGVVYKARDTRLERTVALKFLPREVSEDPAAKERFLREARAAACLDHPNIATVHEVGEDPKGRMFIAMAHYDGETIKKKIERGPLPIDESLDLAEQIASGLAAAHAQGIVHRDIKPANVMATHGGQAKIVDFGIAKIGGTTTLTGPRGTPGTIAYMSPEQLHGEPADHRSDLWSLGVVLYEMIGGSRPFAGDTTGTVVHSVLSHEPGSLVDVRPDCPRAVAGLVGELLEKNPEARPGSSLQVATRLRTLSETSSISYQENGTAVLPATEGAGGGASAAPLRLLRRAPTPATAVAILGAALLVVLGVVLFATRPWSPATPPDTDPGITSVAVLPLDNLSGDPEQEYFADGMTDGLIADLSRISALRVISRQSVMRYKGSEKSLPEIARELDVDALIEGSVLAVGDRVRISAQLVQAEPETHLWSQTYERDTSDVLTLLGEVIQEVVGEIQVVLTAEEQLRLTQSRDVDPEALKAHLKGVYLASQFTPDEVKKSESYFRQAIEIDPSFAAAWAGLANYYQTLEFIVLPHGAKELRDAASAAGKEALTKALELDDSLSRAHTLKAQADFWRNWDWPAAAAGFRRAIELNPNDAAAHSWYAGFLAAMGRCDEAIDEAEIGERLDPKSQSILRLKGEVLYYCHEFERALEQNDKALELFPGNFFLLSHRGFTLAALGRSDEVVKVWQKMRAWMGNEEISRQFEGKSLQEVNHIYAHYAGDPSSAMYSPFVVAKVYAENRETEEALKWLEQVLHERIDPGLTAGYMVPFLRADPDFLYLHSDPRFQDILRRIGLLE